MERRTVLRIVALGALAPQLKRLGAASHGTGEAHIAWAPGGYKLQFFTEAENWLLDQLMETIIPADHHSPGAHAAQVSLFADLMMASSDDSVKAEWRNGLHAIGQEAERSSVAEALARAAAHEDRPSTELERFFAVLKQMTIDGYYTSEIGIHQDLEYVGNTYLPAFPGCDGSE